MKDEYHIWELGERISVEIDPLFLKRILDCIYLQYGTIKLFYDVLPKCRLSYSSFKQELKPSHRFFRDLDSLVLSCNVLKIPLVELEIAVKKYKIRRGKIVVECPLFPLRITPIFDMLIAHHMGDGCTIIGNNNRETRFGYKQFDNNYRRLYTKKICSLYGNVDELEQGDRISTKCPALLSRLFITHYGLDDASFRSTTARVPKKYSTKTRSVNLRFF